MLLGCLLQVVDLIPEFPQRVREQLDDSRLIVGLQYDSGEPKPLDVLYKHINRILIVVDTLLRDNVREVAARH